MIDRKTRLRLRRLSRGKRRQVEVIGGRADESLEKHFFKRLSRLVLVKRFVAGWIILVLLLGGIISIQLGKLGNYYQEFGPVAGGTYSEGMIGTFTNANPLYATGLVDTTVSKLVFSGLLKYDDRNQLVGDLAESWKSSDEGKLYTVKLRPGLTWHDGKPLTAEDVAFTFQTIQNPDARSPLFRAWQNVTIKAVDARTVTFSLPSTLAPFVYGLTTGIVPKHKLESIQQVQLRSSAFNTASPVGSGPFKLNAIEISNGQTNKQTIGFRAFDAYHEGVPSLERFVVKTYPNENELVADFKKQDINGIVGLDKLPEGLAKNKDINEYSVPLTAETLVFLRTDSELLKDVKVRQALVQAVNVPTIINGLGYPTIVADQPLLRGQLGYNAANRQLTTNIDQANKLLDEAGWKQQKPGTVRANGNTKLSLKLLAQNNPDYAYVTQQIQKAWLAVGVDVQVTLPSDSELQSVIARRDYDALIYGVSLGVDPDVFAYWHSTQADPRSGSRLNLSNYKSTAADKALESGRTRIDASLRAAKYLPFLQTWRADAPAIALYQPRFLYITRGELFNFEPKTINSAAERFNNVNKWMIRQDRTLKRPA